MRAKEVFPTLLFILAVLVLAVVPSFSQATSTPQQQLELHTRMAQQYLREQKPDLAVPELQAVIALDPKNVDARANLGVLLFFRGDYTSAIPQLHVALNLQPGLWKIQALLGLAERRTGQQQEGRQDLEAAFPHLQNKKIQLEVGNELIESYSSSGDLESAAATVAAMLKLDPTNLRLLYTAYRVNSDLADQSMLTLALVAPNSAQMHQLMAHELRRHDDQAAAIANYREALKIDPTLPGLHFELGEMLYNSPEPELQGQAEAEYKAALALNPSDEKAASRLGDIAAKRGDLKGAAADYSRALQMQPGDGDADTSLAKVLIAMNETKPAQMLLEQAIRIDPTNYVAHYRLSTMYRQQGRTEDSRRELAQYRKYKDMKENFRKLFQQMRIVTDKAPADRDTHDETDAPPQ